MDTTSRLLPASHGSHAGFISHALRDPNQETDLAWVEWATASVARGRVDPALLADTWHEIVRFDETLARHIDEPVPVPDGTVVVTGSGKESFKTFNVSTAAAILAAAAGARIVKGVSSSVSAVSGSADMLHTLDVPVLEHPGDITAAVYTSRIAFIPYSAFCPRYADRYDGRFDGLSPMSFVMPTATIAVDADRFVHGLAHPDVAAAAVAINAARPGLRSGRVVTSEISADERVDEDAGRGLVRIASITGGRVEVDIRTCPPANDRWRQAVRHMSDHISNARLFVESLSPSGTPDACALTEQNAEVMLSVARPDLDASELRATVREARESSRALKLLRDLRLGMRGKR